MLLAAQALERLQLRAEKGLQGTVSSGPLTQAHAASWAVTMGVTWALHGRGVYIPAAGTQGGLWALQENLQKRV